MQLICVKYHDQCCLFSKFKEDLMLFSYWIFKQWLIKINLCFKKLVLNLKMELNIIFLVVNEWSGLWHSLQWTPPRHMNFKRLICLHSHSSHGAKAVLKCLPPPFLLSHLLAQVNYLPLNSPIFNMKSLYSTGKTCNFRFKFPTPSSQVRFKFPTLEDGYANTHGLPRRGGRIMTLASEIID